MLGESVVIPLLVDIQKKRKTEKRKKTETSYDSLLADPNLLYLRWLSRSYTSALDFMFSSDELSMGLAHFQVQEIALPLLTSSDIYVVLFILPFTWLACSLMVL